MTISNVDKTTDDDDGDEKLAATNDNVGNRADDIKPGPGTESNLSLAVADAPDADHPKDSKKMNRIVLNGILHNPSLFALWLTIDAVELSNNDNDNDSNRIINHEEDKEKEEDSVLVKDEPTSLQVAISPCSEGPIHNDQTHLNDVDDGDHELHATDLDNATGTQICLRIYINKMNKLARERAMIHHDMRVMNTLRVFDHDVIFIPQTQQTPQQGG